MMIKIGSLYNTQIQGRWRWLFRTQGLFK